MKTHNLKKSDEIHDVDTNNNNSTNPDVEHIFLRGDFSCMHDLFTATSLAPKMLYQNHTNYHHFHSKNLQNVQNQQGFQGFSDQDLGKYL